MPWGMRGRDFDDFGPPTGFNNGGGGGFGNGSDNGGGNDGFGMSWSYIFYRTYLASHILATHKNATSPLIINDGIDGLK